MAFERIGIAFHGIGQNARELEPGEERYWISKDAFLRFLDLVASLPDPTRIILTFDDGNTSDHDTALPALLERGLSGSFFITTGRIDRKGSLSASQLRDLSDAGMTVGSNGVDHVDWRKLRPDDLQAEVTLSKQVLEEIVGRAVSTAAVPFGRYDDVVLSALRTAGYRRVYSTDGGVDRKDGYLVGRTNIRSDTTISDFANLAAGRETGVARVVRALKSLRRKFT